MRIDRCKGCGEQIDIASDHKPGCIRDLERDSDRDLAMVDDYAGRRVSASMAEVLAKHQWMAASPDPAERCTCGIYPAAQTNKSMAAHQAEVLAANGYGKLEATRFVLAEREAELLNLKGPCRAPQCRLHHAHRGPCDTRRPE